MSIEKEIRVKLLETAIRTIRVTTYFLLLLGLTTTGFCDGKQAGAFRVYARENSPLSIVLRDNLSNAEYFVSRSAKPIDNDAPGRAWKHLGTYPYLLHIYIRKLTTYVGIDRLTENVAGMRAKPSITYAFVTRAELGLVFSVSRLPKCTPNTQRERMRTMDIEI